MSEATVRMSAGFRTMAMLVAVAVVTPILTLGLAGGAQATDVEGIVVPIPVLTGEAEVGHTLTATVNAVTPSDATVAVQWYRGGTPIAGAVETTYLVSDADVGEPIWARVTASKDGYEPATSQSAMVLATPVATERAVIAFNLAGSKVSVVPGTSDVVALATGQCHTIALHADGTVSAWGIDCSSYGTNNRYGQLSVPTELDDVVAIAAGAFHNLALRGDGTVVAWGYNANGQSTVPVSVSDVVGIAAGQNFSVVLKSDGTVFAWGLDDWQILDVPAGLSDVVSISAGFFHTLALKADGTVVAWGNPMYDAQEIPAEATDVVAIFAGTNTNFALTREGTVAEWGYSAPLAGVDGRSDATQLASSSYQGITLRTDGAVVLWNDSATRAAPANLRDVAAVEAGYEFYAIAAAPSPGTTTLEGDAIVGQRLQVLLGDGWLGGATYTYQWFRDAEPIAGATAAIYDLAVDDASHVVSVETTATWTGDYSTTSTAATPTPAALATFADVTPTISGQAVYGETLVSSAGSWPQGTTLTYQWFRGEVAVDGATSADYALSPEDVGTHISVVVTGSKAGYATATKLSENTVAVAPATLDGATPTLVGSAVVGSTLTANVGVWTEGASLAYRWFRSGLEIVGAHGTTYTLDATDVGKTLSVQVTGAKAGFAPLVLASTSTGAVKLATLVRATPAIAGKAKAGIKLTAKPGAWTSGTTFKYQWYANGKAIPKAAAATFTPTASQTGKTITVTVTGSKAGYATASVTSKATAKVVAYSTLKKGTPKVTGTLKVGKTLTAKAGTWTTGTTFKYQWYANGVAIKGATGKTLILKSSQRAKVISVKVTGSKAGYATASATSKATAKVVAYSTLKKGTPKVTGTLKVGKTLTAKAGTWTTGTTFKYQWYANGVAIKGATGKTLILKSSQRAKVISVKVTGKKAGYATASRLSAKTIKVR